MNLNIRISKAYTTHIALLLKVLDHSEGAVYEFGAGLYSTPLLHWYCKNKNRKLTTFEDDPIYYEVARRFSSGNHYITKVDNWSDIKVKSIGLLFIDSGGKAEGGYGRGLDAIRFKDNADYIVLHDTEEKYTKVYNYDKMWPEFKNVFTWKECIPYTSVVSNLKDLSWLKE